MAIAGWIVGIASLAMALMLWLRNRHLTATIKQSEILFELSAQFYSAEEKQELLLGAIEGVKRLVHAEQAAVVLADESGGLTETGIWSAPLTARGRQLGLLQASGKQGGKQLTAMDQELITKLSGTLAVALDNAILHEMSEESLNELHRATALKERFESELQIAGSIQLSFLPTTMPSTNEPFDVCALLKSAKEVGGDFYNFFKIDEDHLFFTLGDVSDKGIPAALFMAMTLSLLKGKMNPDVSPGELLKKVNDELCTDNAQLFATIVCGVLQISTGEAVLSDGGHCTPYVVKADGEVLPIKLTKGIPLGSFPEFTYKNVTLQLERGDKLVIYTDGITEAENALQEQYSAGRLQEFLGQTKDYSSAEIIDALLMDVFMFADGAPQSDDIAVLCLMRR